VTDWKDAIVVPISKRRETFGTVTSGMILAYWLQRELFARIIQKTLQTDYRVCTTTLQSSVSKGRGCGV
jgi:hypothetical protein